MKVEDIMTQNVVTVSPESKITEVAEILFKNKFHALPVVESTEIVGIIAETDFFTRDSENFFLPAYVKFLEKNIKTENGSKEQQEKAKKLFNARARDIMSANCTTVYKDTSLDDLLEIFKTTKFATLPVVDEKNFLVGVVTLSDIISLVKIK